jgi:polysaccharide pyruvyl transferase WcaK-like protein
VATVIPQLQESDPRLRPRARQHVAVYGHFGTTNFGNESTLLALLLHLRVLLPDGRFTCICTHPEVVAEAHRVEAVPISPKLLSTWAPRNGLTRFIRKLCVGIPSEPYRWVKGFGALRDTELLIVPGTNLLTDVDGLLGYGPYNLFRWALTARLRRCELAFLSVGAGPIHGALGRMLVRGALSLAASRSYRDHSTKEYLERIGFCTDGDPVVPDLAFSLPEVDPPEEDARAVSVPTVGLGVMADPWKYGPAGPDHASRPEYLASLVGVAEWFLGRGYDVRMLIGDRWDLSAVKEFRRLLDEALPDEVPGQIVQRPIISLGDLMSEVAACDLVVATRFHNVLFALLCEKPTIAVSFHHKCESLMRAMGLSEYCVDLDEVDADLLIRKAQKLEARSDDVKGSIREMTSLYRRALDWQYEQLCGAVPEPPDGVSAPPPLEAEAVKH